MGVLVRDYIECPGRFGPQYVYRDPFRHRSRYAKFCEISIWAFAPLKPKGHSNSPRNQTHAPFSLSRYWVKGLGILSRYSSPSLSVLKSCICCKYVPRCTHNVVVLQASPPFEYRGPRVMKIAGSCLGLALGN